MRPRHLCFALFAILAILSGCSEDGAAPSEAPTGGDGTVASSADGPTDSGSTPIDDAPVDDSSPSPAEEATAGSEPELEPEPGVPLGNAKAEQLPEETEAASATPRERSHALNGEAFTLYQQGRFEEAAGVFKEAIEADESYYLPRFNYACTVAILIREDAPNWHYMEDEVLDQLAAVLALNPDYLPKVKSDPDLEAVRKNYHYLELIGITPDTPDGVREILTRLDWYVPGEGIFPYFGGADFRDDGTVELWFNTPDWYESFEDEDRYRVSGRFETDSSAFTITLDEQMLRKRSAVDIHDNQDVLDPSTVFQGSVNTDGTLSLEDFDYDLEWSYEQFSA